MPVSPTPGACLELVDPVPAVPLFEGQHVLKAFPPVRAGRAPHRAARHEALPPVVAVQLPGAAAGDPEPVVLDEEDKEALEVGLAHRHVGIDVHHDSGSPFDRRDPGLEGAHDRPSALARAGVRDADHGDPGRVSLEGVGHRGRVVGRAVLDDDPLGRRKRLRAERFCETGQRERLVTRCRDDGVRSLQLPSHSSAGRSIDEQRRRG